MTSLSRQEYLKRYLSPHESSDKVKKKRKKKSEAVKKVHGFKIVDDDVGWDSLAPKQDEFDDLNDKLLTVDEKPQIENIDVRTEEEKKLDEYRQSKMWKKLDADLDVARPSKKYVRTRHDSDSDLDALPRQRKKKEAKRRPRHDSDSDIDVPREKSSSKSRKRHDSDSDLDVQRNNTSPSQKSNMQGGGRGGLTSVDLLRLEMQKLEKKESAMKEMAEEYKHTATVYRERGSGKKRDLAKEQKDDEAEKLRKKKKEDQYNKWGRGLKQAELRADAIADTLHESSKSLTRYADDEDLEAMRKSEMRPEDPMAEYIARKKQKEKGKSNDRPKYKGPAPAPNRYSIMPGYRWDGVDRSNGFEKRYYQSMSDKQALKDEYYKWSVGDM